MGRNHYKKRTHLTMYRSLASALLVAATQAAGGTYTVATGQTSAAASPKISASSCTITVTVATATVTVVVAQTATGAAAIAAAEIAEAACSWSQTAAIWWVHVGSIEGSSTASEYLATAQVYKFTAAPVATDLTANSLFTGSTTTFTS